jgi:Spy/CpxP family protein refolding chaperone
MLDLLRYLGNARFALACVFALVIAGTLAVAVPAWSQTPLQEQEATAIEEENAQVDMGRGGRAWRADREDREVRASRAGRAGMFERMAVYFRGGAGAHSGMRGGRAGMSGPQAGMMGRRGGMPGAHAGMRGGRPGFAAGAQGRRPGMPGGPMDARRGRAGIGGGRFDLASRALGRAEEISLTDVQRQGIEEARDAYRRQQIERDASMKLVNLDVVELLKDETSDLAIVEQKMNEVAGLRVDEQMAALRYQRNVRGILGAEQIEQLRDFSGRTTRRGPSDDRTPRTQRQR